MKEIARSDDEQCPYKFNFDAETFKVGDMVSYRVPDRFDDFPFVGELIEVNADSVLISPNDPTQPERRYLATRTNRPLVDGRQIVQGKS